MQISRTCQATYLICLILVSFLSLANVSFADASFVPGQGLVVKFDIGSVSGYKIECLNSTMTSKVSGSVGPGWLFSLDATMKANQEAQAVSIFAFSRQFSFLQSPDGTYKPVGGATGILDKVEDEFYLTCEGVKIHFSKDGILKSAQDKSGEASNFIFDAKGRISGWSLKSDKTVDVSFDDNLGALPGSQEDGKVTWNKDGLVEIISRRGIIVKFTYDSGKLKSIASSDGRKWSIGYDEKSRVAKFAEPGLAYTITYDSEGRTASLEKSTGEAQYFKYSTGKDGEKVIVWNTATSKETEYLLSPKSLTINESRIYSAPDRSLAVDREKGSAACRTADGNMYSLARKPDDTTEFRTLMKGSIPLVMTATPDELIVRNEAGDELFREKTASSKFISRATSEFKANGVLKDLSGNVLEMISGGSTVASFKYDKAGLLKEIISPSEKVLASFKYDDKGRLLSMENAAGDKTLYLYDDKKNTVVVTSPSGSKMEYHFDSYGRPVRTVSPMGKELIYNYGKDGMVSSVESPGFDLQEYFCSYDKSSSFIGSKLSGRWDFRSVEDGKFIVRISPDSAATNFCYDDLGRLYATTDEKGQVISFFKYDKAGNLANFANPTLKYELGYDTLGRQASVKELNSGYGITYSYDTRGAIAATRDSDKDITEYSYDSAGRPVEVRHSKAGKFTVKYNPAGMPALLSRPNGVKTKWEYDDLGRLSKMSFLFPDEKENLSFSYKYDRAGNISEIASSKDGKTAFKYDSLSHLCNVKSDKDGELKLEYDKWGNLLSYGGSKAEFKASGAVKFSDGFEYAADAQARIISAKCGNDSFAFKYDRENRLENVLSDGKAAATFGYDNLGRLGFSSENGISKRYFYVMGYLCAAVSQDRKESVKYVNFPLTGECLAVARGDGRIEYPLSDPAGTITHLTDEKGNISATRQFEAIGLQKGADKMNISAGYSGGIQFLGGRLIFIDNTAYLAQAARSMAVKAPMPGDRTLKSYNPLSMLNANPNDKFAGNF